MLDSTNPNVGTPNYNNANNTRCECGALSMEEGKVFGWLLGG
jgi:hypothetical protein